MEPPPKTIIDGGGTWHGAKTVSWALIETVDGNIDISSPGCQSKKIPSVISASENVLVLSYVPVAVNSIVM